MTFFRTACLGICSITASLQGVSWAEKTLETMSVDEKIGQLFMVAAYVDPEYAAQEIGNDHIIEEMGSLIRDYPIGGLCFVGPSEFVKQVKLTNQYQKLSKYPLLIAQDLEWGLSMRIKEGMRFPNNSTLGAIQEDRLIYEMGREIGKQARLIGVHMNLSPVLDVNTESENIAINVRSFGSSPKEVALKGVAMIQGLQDAGLISSAKHFPGIGGIGNIDPHLGLPYCYQDKEQLEKTEFYPFVKAIEAGVLSIQNEHVVVPSLDAKLPASLSFEVITRVLKGQLGFTGLVLSGALRMKALTQNFSEEEIVLKAFRAGNDMLLMPENVIQAHQILKKALNEGEIKLEEINERVLKILQVKQRVKLDQQTVVEIPSLEDLQPPVAIELKTQLFRKAVSLLRNEKKLIPISADRIGYIQLGENSSEYFTLLHKQLPLERLSYDQLEDCPLIILAVYPVDPRRIVQIRLLAEKNQRKALKDFRVHGLSDPLIQSLKDLEPYKEKMIVVYFGNPFGLQFFEPFSSLIMAYEVEKNTEEEAADLLLRKLR